MNHYKVEDAHGNMHDIYSLACQLVQTGHVCFHNDVGLFKAIFYCPASVILVQVGVTEGPYTKTVTIEGKHETPDDS